MNPCIDDWTNRRVWLVGASSGIGAALARALAMRGARLALSARRPEALAEIARGFNGLCLPADVTQPDDLAHAAAQIRAAWGGFDLVVYLAGDYQPMRAEDFDLAIAERIMAVNYGGALKLFDAVHRDLRPGNGIVFVASVAGYCGLPRALAYGPGKAALIHFAECLHLELAPRGIGVWVVNPGFVATRLTARNGFAMPALMTSDEAAEAIIAGLRRGRFEIHFPKRFTRLMKFVSHLPYAGSFALIRRVTGQR